MASYLHTFFPEVKIPLDPNEVVSPAQFSLPSSSAKQELTPVDLVIPGVYGTRWILCFPLAPKADKAQIFHNLRQGLAHTINSIPWISGNVGSEEGSKPQIVDSSIPGVVLRHQDLAGTMPSYAELEEQRFPLGKLTTAQLSPVGCIPTSPAPVMVTQANFIEGGLLLTVAIHHHATDATGLGEILRTWAQNTAAAASGSSTFTSYDASSNDRSVLMHGIPPKNKADFPEYTIKAPKEQIAPEAAPPPPAAFQLPPMDFNIFHFSSAKLAGLKLDAAAYSTNDAMSAFLWHHMTKARNPSSSPADLEGKTSAWAYAVNTRGRATPPLPSTYLGNAAVLGMTERLPVSELLAGESGLAHAATAIRASLKRHESPTLVQELVGLLDAHPGCCDLAYNSFMGPDVVSTSWADVEAYSTGWGNDLGAPAFLRVPGDGADGLVNILPRRPDDDGGLEVIVWLEAGAMGRLWEARSSCGSRSFGASF
ncbi:hypothetical protein PG997_012256 [Apiospora hydei]|uniref:Trichothecene 3-O-acetyltransferase n=1 Tax=Apiospora hydei TaxID=1337664 RepID=A0ABR1V634_9PEZI